MKTSTVIALLVAAAPLFEGTSLVAQGTPGSGTTEPSVFAPLTLGPAPSRTRLANGAPGPKYWQNRADYAITATLDTAANVVRGSMTLRYTNNSPDPLPFLWLQTENRKEEIKRFDQVLGGKTVPLTYGHPTGDVFELQVTLTEPLKPGQTATLHADWDFPVKGSQREGTLFEITQWYPRLNVYDDVKGWNTESYATGAEYFLEYGDYSMELTLPAGYVVAATGTLDNPKDVLTPTEISRLAVAARADTVVRVVTAAELQSGTARPTQSGTLTWKFHSRNTRDMVWAAAPDYQWDATSWHGVLAQAYYRPSAAETWSDAADQARMSIQEYSERWYPYPYPQISAVEGPERGMEYPMLSMVDRNPDQPKLYGVITHEIGHNWFPMIVGSNERMHTWMDEGFNNFINSFSEARRYPQNGDQNARIKAKPTAWDQAVLENGTVIGNTLPQYRKTAQVLQVLRRDVMGPELFDKGFKTYIRNWAYKHPTPMDFFRTMTTAYGHDLDWFWRECFLEAPHFDQTIDSVHQTVQGGDAHVSVTYGNKGRMVMPLLVRFTFSDSTTRDVTYPADVWRTNPASYTASYTFPRRTVSRIVLDPDGDLPDTERTNNTWTAQ